MKNIIKFYEKGSIEIVYGQSTHCFPLHSHESFCVGAVIKGSALFTINSTEHLLKESMAFIIPSNTGISISSNFEYNYITICFKNELKKRVENIKFNNYYINLKSSEEILNLCDSFKRNNDEELFFNHILKLIGNAIMPASSTEKNQPDEIVLLISEYIKTNAAEKFDLDKLAETFYLSKYHLIRMFKKEMGVTPYQYYIQSKIRIIKSKVFNAPSETNLAMNLNLFDKSHLCHLFKKQMGISIKGYKRNLIKKWATFYNFPFL